MNKKSALGKAKAKRLTDAFRSQNTVLRLDGVRMTEPHMMAPSLNEQDWRESDYSL